MTAAAVALLTALVGPSGVAAASFDFALLSPSVSTVAYSDMVTFRGAYTCLNDATSTCPTTMQTHTATFSLRPSGGSTFTTVGTVTTTFVFTSNPAGCATTCSVNFQLAWRSGRIGTATVAPGVYDIGLTTTLGPGQLVATGALTITPEGTTTTYIGAASGLGNTTLALGGTVLDHDRGLSPGTGIISPDANLAGAGVVTFELYDETNTTRVAGPVLANLTAAGLINGSPSILLPASGGTFRLRTTYAGNAFYTGSSDLDTITVAASNTPPVLSVPGAPIVVEATSPLGGAADFTVGATDLEDDPDPSPTCSHTSGSTFPVGDTTVTCSVVDSGGLGDTQSFVVRVVDTTDPSVAVSTSESAAATGWYNAASNDGVPGVTVDVTTGDLVGVASLACAVDGLDVGPLDPAGDSFVVLDGQHVVSCVATDGAGNDAQASASFDVDQTAPTIVASVGPAATPSGWWNAATGAPTATFACSDATSGVASCSAPFTFGEGADQSTTGTATDAAGNAATTEVSGVDVDLTPPASVTFTGGGLVAGGEYAFLFVPAGPSGCTATDAVSGVASCIVSGYGDSVGAHTVTGIATDGAGNTVSGTLDYSVAGWTLVGFAKPIDMDAVNDLRAGNTAQLKLDVLAGSVRLTSPDVISSVEATQVTCATEPPAPKGKGNGNGNNGNGNNGNGKGKPGGGGAGGVVVDVGGNGRFTVRWTSPDQPGTCWLVTVTTLDGSSLSATFSLR